MSDKETITENQPLEMVPEGNPPGQKPSYEYFDRIRAIIQHEDGLVNHRLMWMITLHGLLFTAYGFSLGAEANALGSPAIASNPLPGQVEAYRQFHTTVETLRYAIGFTGALSAFAALLGVSAAFRVIKENERGFDGLPYKTSGFAYPKLIGERLTNNLGMCCGLAVPFLSGAVWTCILGSIVRFIPGVCFAAIIVAIGLVLAYCVRRFIWRESESPEPVKQPGEGN